MDPLHILTGRLIRRLGKPRAPSRAPRAWCPPGRIIKALLYLRSLQEFPSSPSRSNHTERTVCRNTALPDRHQPCLPLHNESRDHTLPVLSHPLRKHPSSSEIKSASILVSPDILRNNNNNNWDSLRLKAALCCHLSRYPHKTRLVRNNRPVNRRNCLGFLPLRPTGSWLL